jgi:predicted transcriptional regulator YheO
VGGAAVTQAREGNLPPVLVATLASLANGLVQTFGRNFEIVVHDFALLPNSIVVVAGNVTGRSVGGPMTNLGFKQLRAGMKNDVMNYRSSCPDGRPLKCSTMVIRNEQGDPLGCFCINVDLTELDIARTAIDRICMTQSADVSGEVFAKDISDVLQECLDWALEEVGVPVQLMQKEHKLMVVERLYDRGVFQVRGVVSQVAKILRSSKYTIYNYLEEVKASK